MGLQLKVEPKKHYLHLWIEGEYSLESAIGLFEPLLRAGAGHPSRRILADIRRMKGSPTTLDRLRMAEEFSKRYHERLTAGTLEGCRFAYLGTAESIDPQGFGETVAVNRGIDLKVTTSLAEALAYLGVEPEDE